LENPVYLFDLGHLSGQQSMLVFHALARMDIEGLVIVSPDVPLVSIGYFQDAAQEVDLDHCRRIGLPFMRREVSGGATYLDRNQVFYQVIWKRGSPRFPVKVKEIFQWISSAAVETYGAFGSPAAYRSVNDIVTPEGRKIAGEGGGNIGGCMVAVGGILMDFDCAAMSRVLRVPDEKLRDKVFKTMEENLTTMRRELGEPPPRDEVVRVLGEKFEKLLGKLEPASLTPAITGKMEELERWLTSEAFLHRRGKPAAGVKIREGVRLHYGMHKAPGGLIRTAGEIQEERIRDIVISGDFTFMPKERLTGLERHLVGAPLEEKRLVKRVDDFLGKEDVEMPGVSPDDIKDAIL
jgi:lipoate-protein ligase A